MNFPESAIPPFVTEQWRIAIKTAGFTESGIQESDLGVALEKSSQRALQRLLQALLREDVIDSNLITPTPDGAHLIRLNDAGRLLITGLISHRMSALSLKDVTFLQSDHLPPRSIISPSELLSMLAPLFDESVSLQALMRLSDELDNSWVNDTLSQGFHNAWSKGLFERYGSSPHTNFLAGLKADTSINASILLEQWGTTGHPWHPNYKTKLGLSPQQVIDFSPEFGAKFDITLCALHKNFAHVERLNDTCLAHCDLFSWLPEVMQRFNDTLARQGLNASDYIPLPIHPWQASETLPSLFADEIRDRLLVLTDVKAFTALPTMSFRTVLPQAHCAAPMVKLPVGLRLTSVQRTLSPRSACMGPRVTSLLQNILENEPTLRHVLSIVPEETGVHYKSPYPQDDRARHLAALFRTNPSLLLQQGELAIPVGSLFTFDHNNEPLLSQWVALAEGAATADAAHAFLERYLEASLPGLLRMYLLYGVAFEAHQQNSFMIMGSDWLPSRILVRDFGDIRIDRRTLKTRGMDLELQDPAMTLYDDSGFVRDKLVHTVFMCHLGELILLISRHWQIPECQLWNTLRDHVSRCFEELRERTEPERWNTERQALLESDWPAKSFMRMRLLDCQTDIVRRLKNPLNMPAHDK